MEERKEVFALDIGTRTIVGMVVRKEDDNNFKILAQEMTEHNSRVMYDGQIHDIEAVAKSVMKVKKALEKRIGFRLEKAAVAAAGRSLYTVEVSAQKDVSPYTEITQEDIESLEADALSNAVKSLSKDNYTGFEDYHCVGYSVVKWFLDDLALDNLLGQKGHKISTEIVAIFLPRTVVESLLSVLQRCDMELYSITLEPIAASDIVVPHNMRKLNIALVDIGAGTSDIAISKNGSIVAYGMVPIAGDEITENLCETYLLDFDEGEKLKRKLYRCDSVEFYDILGKYSKLASVDILEEINSGLQSLAAEIARKILELNGRAPAAVMCIGGGSLMPRITEYIANNLELSKNRVGVKSGEEISFLIGDEKISGPVSITPLGIAVNALSGTYLSFIKVHVNEKPINILGQSRPTVIDVLIYAGYSSAEIFGRPGLAKTLKVNGELKIVKGTMGIPAKVYINGTEADLKTYVNDGFYIDFVPAQDGKPGKALIKDFIKDEQKLNLKINGRDFSIDPIITMNGKTAKPLDTITDDANIVIKRRNIIVSDLFTIIDFKIDAKRKNLVMKINGENAGFASSLKDNDEVEIYWQKMV